MKERPEELSPPYGLDDESWLSRLSWEEEHVGHGTAPFDNRLTNGAKERIRWCPTCKHLLVIEQGTGQAFVTTPHGDVIRR